jgi:hypothetical protein
MAALAASTGIDTFIKQRISVILLQFVGSDDSDRLGAISEQKSSLGAAARQSNHLAVSNRLTGRLPICQWWFPRELLQGVLGVLRGQRLFPSGQPFKIFNRIERGVAGRDLIGKDLRS